MWTGRRALEDAACDAVALAIGARGQERERAALAPMLSRSAGALDRVDKALPSGVRVWVGGSGRKVPQRIRAPVRSGQVAAKGTLMGPPSDSPSSAARREPAASITAWTSSMRSSSGAGAATGSESPRATLVEQDQPRELRQLLKETRDPRIRPLKVQVRDEARHEHKVDRTVADDLIRDADLAAARVMCLGGSSHPSLLRYAHLGQAEWPPSLPPQPSTLQSALARFPNDRHAAVVRRLALVALCGSDVARVPLVSSSSVDRRAWTSPAPSGVHPGLDRGRAAMSPRRRVPLSV